MKFVKKEEILNLIKLNTLDNVTEDDNNLLDSIEAISLSEIDSYIGSVYNTTEVFSKTGNDRNQFMLATVIDIMLYHIHARLTASDIPEVRFLRYQKTVNWLEQVAKGKLTPNLPLLNKEFSPRSSESRFGSALRVNNMQW